MVSDTGIPLHANGDANSAASQSLISDESKTQKGSDDRASTSVPNGNHAGQTKWHSKQTPMIDITKDLSALVSIQMRERPDAIALEDETTKLTYGGLDEKVTVLANRLRDHGVGRDSRVGVLLGRSAHYVIACLAALRAGGAFLVLELAYPPNLLADVIDDAKPTVVITNSTQANQINADVPLIILHDEGTGEHKTRDNPREHAPLPADNDLDRLAFVSYSSGTTGRPVSLLSIFGSLNIETGPKSLPL